MAFSVTNVYAGMTRGICTEMNCSCQGFQTSLAQPGACLNCMHGPFSYVVPPHAVVGLTMAPAPSPLAPPPPMSTSVMTGLSFVAPPPPVAAVRPFQVNVDWNKLRVVELIGQGSFGYVHKAYLDRTLVAIKRLQAQVQDTELISLFNRELAVVREIRHPNILQFLYSHDQPPNMMIMTELMPGSLRSFLGQRGFPFEAPHIVKVSLCVARAMSFLHSMSPPVLHRDLKSTHVLMDLNYNAKVSGFGMTKVRDYGSRLTGQQRVLNWSAPEVMEGRAVQQSDVYSFGMIVWEMLTREVPFAHLTNPMDIARAVLNGERPVIPPWTHPEIAKMLIGCWVPNPEARPSFEYIIDFLERTFPQFAF